MKLHEFSTCMIIMLCSYAATSLEHEKSFLLQDRASNVNAVGLYKDSLLMSSSNDVVQRDIETGMLQRTFRAHDRTVLSLAITNDSRMITSGYDNMIVVWDLVAGSILKRISLRISDAVIESLIVKNDLVIGGCDDYKVRQVDLLSGRIVRTIGNSITAFQLDGFCRVT